ncbi:MAG: peptide deformylase [Phycisphaerales bacterium]
MTVTPNNLAILSYPADVLRRPSAAIDRVNDEVRAVAIRMIELMIAADGVGLAAPQVGLPWRMFVTRSREPDDHLPHCIFINPTLSAPSDDVESAEEGCLSLPGVTVTVQRHRAVTVNATNLDGHEFSLTGEGLDARIWQHEHNHLDGILIIDRMSPMDRLANRRAIRDLRKAAGE